MQLLMLGNKNKKGFNNVMPTTSYTLIVTHSKHTMSQSGKHIDGKITKNQRRKRATSPFRQRMLQIAYERQRSCVKG